MKNVIIKTDENEYFETSTGITFIFDFCDGTRDFYDAYKNDEKIGYTIFEKGYNPVGEWDYTLDVLDENDTNAHI